MQFTKKVAPESPSPPIMETCVALRFLMDPTVVLVFQLDTDIYDKIFFLKKEKFKIFVWFMHCIAEFYVISHLNCYVE